MKFTINQKTLLAALSICSKAVNQNNIIPILGSFLFEGKNDKLIVHTSDQENYISFELDCACDAFLVAIPAKILTDLITELPDQELTINLVNGTAEITALSGLYKIPYDGGSDFPIITHNSDFEISLDCGLFLKAINKSSFACATNHSVLAFNSLLVELSENLLTCVGCDGWVMSVQSLKVLNDRVYQFLLSPKSLGIISQLPYNDELRISISKTSAKFILNDDTVFICLLVDEKYPNYKSVLPKDNDKFFTANKSLLLPALKRLKVFANERTDDCDLQVSSDTILTSQNLKSEEAKETVTGEFKGEEISIKIKCSLAIQCLSKIDDELVTFTFSEPKKAVLINTSDESSLMMIMPIF